MRVVWSREALADMQRAWLFLADRSVDYADKVKARIDRRLASVASLPRQGRPVPESDLRTLTVPDIQYLIVYRLDEASIRVMRIYSTRENWRMP